MENNNQIESIKQLVEENQEVRTLEIEGGPDLNYLIIDGELKVLDSYNAAPRYTDQSIQLNTIESFVAYVDKYKIEHTSIFATPFTMEDDRSLAKCLIDFHAPDQGAWCKHKVALNYKFTPEWNIWCRGNDARMSQRQMINFLKDNAAQIAEPALSKLVEEMSSLTVNTNGKLVTVEAHGQAARNQEKEVKVTAALPDIMKLQMKPILGSDPYIINCRFNVMPDLDSGVVEFSYTMNNREETLNKLYDEYCDKLGAIADTTLYR